MSNEHVVVEDREGVRATVGIDAVPQHELRGFTVIGPAVAPGDARTPDEAAAEATEQAAQVEAVRTRISKTSKSGPTGSATSKKEK